jgi:hypothetical protein
MGDARELIAISDEVEQVLRIPRRLKAQFPNVVEQVIGFILLAIW